MNDQTDPLGETTIDVRPHLDPARTQIIPAVSDGGGDTNRHWSLHLARRLRDHFAASLSGQFPDQWHTVHQLATAVDVDPGHKQQMRSLYALLDAMHALGALEQSSHGGWLTYRGHRSPAMPLNPAAMAPLYDVREVDEADGRDLLDPRSLLLRAVREVEQAESDSGSPHAWAEVASAGIRLAELEHRRRVDQVDDVDEQVAELIRERAAVAEREKLVERREEHVAHEIERARKLYGSGREVRLAGPIEISINAHGNVMIVRCDRGNHTMFRGSFAPGDAIVVDGVDVITGVGGDR